MRMRNRRAERCLQRAHAALDAGLINDSVEAFEEAQQLNPAGAGVQEFAQRLNSAKAPVPPVPERRLARYAAIAGILMVLSGLTAWWTLHRSGGGQEASQSHADVSLETAAPANELPSLPLPTARDPEIPEAPATPPVPAESRKVAVASLTAAKEPEPTVVPPPRPEARSIGTVGLEVTAPKPDAAPLPRETAPPTPDPLPTTELVLPPSSTVPSAPPAPPLPPINSRAAATVPVSPAASAPDQRAAIRTTLGRYEAAYSELNVSAVQAVWPAIDQRALSRAFSSLASQRVSLENCNVDVTGGTARANCSGTAAWTPKVGGGLHTTARNWVFELTQSEGSWHIVRVQAR